MRLVLAVAAIVCGWFALCCLALLSYRWVDPPVTTVQMQRRVESWFSDGEYKIQHRWTPLGGIPLEVQRAVIAAEDGAFYQHSGIDWDELGIVLDGAWQGEGMRGASTITQQLVKNLFLTTHSSVFRKLPEYLLTPVAEMVLSKDRIFELYLNEIEWGPGVWGIGAAAQHHYNRPVENLNRRQAARLAACVPAPRSRRPTQMDDYSRVILDRMASRGW